MKMYAGTSAEGTLITATTESGENGVIYTYTMPADAKSFYFVNSSTYNVHAFSLSINGSGDLVVSDETKANKVLTDEAAKFEAKYSANATVTLAEGVAAAVKEGTTATTVAISGSTVTITPADTKENVVLVLSYTLKGQAYTNEVSFSTELPASGATVSNVTYNAPTDTVEIVWGTDVSSFFTFPAGVVASAVVNQGSCTESSTKFYTASARIYKGAEVVITAAEGYTFSALEITYDSDKYGVITISEDGKTITISAANSQIRIKAMTLSYVAE